MIGTLQDVFEISGRGCVVTVEVISGSCRIGDSLTVGGNSWPISGIEMPNYRLAAVERMKQGWVPPLGLLLKNAKKADLIEEIGGRCSTLAADAS